MPAHALVWKASLFPLPLRAWSHLFSPCHLSFGKSLFPVPPPLNASLSARSAAPLPRYLPPHVRSSLLPAAQGEALSSSGAGLADAQHRRNRQIVYQSSMYEQ